MEELEKKINEVKQEEDDTHASQDNGEPTPTEVDEGATTPTEVESEETLPTPTEEIEKMIPQSEVNNLVGRTRKEAREKARAEYLAELLEKYGLADENEMDGIFGKGQQYDVLNEDYANQSNEFTAMREENALLKSEVVPEKWEDAKLIIKGKGLQVTPETIASELATHPEWLGQVQQGGKGQEQVTPALEVLGDETENKPQAPSDDEIINKFFGV